MKWAENHVQNHNPGREKGRELLRLLQKCAPRENQSQIEYTLQKEPKKVKEIMGGYRKGRRNLLRKTKVHSLY